MFTMAAVISVFLVNAIHDAVISEFLVDTVHDAVISVFLVDTIHFYYYFFYSGNLYSINKLQCTICTGLPV